MTRVDPSWNHLHRLGLTATDQAACGPYNPHHSTYAVQVTGDLDLDRLALAWQATQLRHRALNGCFDLADRSWEPAATEPAALGVSHLTGDAGPDAAERELGRVLRSPFDLARGPLARMHVAAVPGGPTLVGIAVEHLVCDGWSLAVLAKDLWSYYADTDAQLPPVRVSFPNFVESQHRYLDSADGRRDLKTWAERLRTIGSLPEIRFPGFTPAPGPVDYSSTSAVGYAIDAETYQGLRNLGGSLGLSPIGLVNAALSGAVHELTGLTDFGVVLSVANRSDRAVRATVGWLSGKVVVPFEVHHAVETAGFLQDYAAASAAAFDYAHLPLAAVIHEVDPHLVGIPCPHPWVAFNPMPFSVNRHLAVPDVPGLELTEFAVGSGWYDASVAVSATDTGDRLVGKLSFKTDWYAAPAIEAVRDHILQLLEQWSARSHA